jgi:O-antigen/teichoic acid export membrane protein
VVVAAYLCSLTVPVVLIGPRLALHLRHWRGQNRPLELGPVALFRRLFGYSGYLVFATLAMIMMMTFSPWILRKTQPGEVVGLYAFPHDLMQWVTLLSVALWSSLQNSANRLWESGRREAAVRQIGRVFRITGWGLWLMAAGVALAARPIAALLPDAYRATDRLMPWLLAFHFTFAVMAPAVAMNSLLKNTALRLISTLLGLATHVGLTLLLLNLLDGVSGELAARRVAQAIFVAATVASGTLWLMVTASARRSGHQWVGRREAMLLITPLLLLAPGIWPTAGLWMLGAVAAILLGLMLTTEQLLTREDRAALLGYLRQSLPGR